MKHLIIAVTFILLSFSAGAEDKQCSGLKADNLQYDSFLDFSKELDDETYYKLQEDLYSLNNPSGPKTKPALELCFSAGNLDCKRTYFYAYALDRKLAQDAAMVKCLDSGADRCVNLFCITVNII